MSDLQLGIDQVKVVNHKVNRKAKCKLINYNKKKLQVSKCCCQLFSIVDSNRKNAQKAGSSAILLIWPKKAQGFKHDLTTKQKQDQNMRN